MLQLQNRVPPLAFAEDEMTQRKQPKSPLPELVTPVAQARLEANRNPSDQALIEACRKGDAKAWQTVLDRYERLVFSIPRQYGLSRDDAADISQLTFTILLQSLHTLEENSRLGPWLATVARRHTWRLIERNRREGVNEAEDLTESIALHGDASADFTNRWELLEWLDYGLSRLDPRGRELIMALYFDPQKPSYAEIAARLDMPVGSIGPTRARCLERLYQILQDK